MRSDIEIAQSIELRPIVELAWSLGLTGDDIVPYGRYIAKIPLGVMDRLNDGPDGKL
ncbi:MAG TPA: formate--tetrahydrofolate ligase, partial [Deltaproteobacteria bacterium]|nr:formate--tetrahydrofolate ligase [Deltaproteobacteria bacterium]